MAAAGGAEVPVPMSRDNLYNLVSWLTFVVALFAIGHCHLRYDRHGGEHGSQNRGGEPPTPQGHPADQGREAGGGGPYPTRRCPGEGQEKAGRERQKSITPALSPSCALRPVDSAPWHRVEGALLGSVVGWGQSGGYGHGALPRSPPPPHHRTSTPVAEVGSLRSASALHPGRGA